MTFSYFVLKSLSKQLYKFTMAGISHIIIIIVIQKKPQHQQQ